MIRHLTAFFIALFSMLLLLPQGAQAQASFTCNKNSTKAEHLVCEDDMLAALDLKLAGVYAEAVSQVKGSSAEEMLRGTQQHWLTSRDSCINDPHSAEACMQKEYALRISELEAGFGLIEPKGVSHYTCSAQGLEDLKLDAYSFDTIVPTLAVKKGNVMHLTFLGRSGEELRYTGHNLTLYRDQGKSMVQWGDVTWSCDAI